jgi:hypothetical protein
MALRQTLEMPAELVAEKPDRATREGCRRACRRPAKGSLATGRPSMRTPASSATSVRNGSTAM